MSFYPYSGVSSSVCFVSEADGLSFPPTTEEWHRVVTLMEARLHVDLPVVLILSRFNDRVAPFHQVYAEFPKGIVKIAGVNDDRTVLLVMVSGNTVVGLHNR